MDEKHIETISELTAQVKIILERLGLLEVQGNEIMQRLSKLETSGQYSTGDLEELFRKIEKLNDKLGELNTSIAVNKTKVMAIISGISIVISLVVSIIASVISKTVWSL